MGRIGGQQHIRGVAEAVEGERARLGRPVLLIGARPGRPRTLTLDGRRDAAYVLLATDPTPDLAASLAPGPDTNWGELSEMYVTVITGQGIHNRRHRRHGCHRGHAC